MLGASLKKSSGRPVGCATAFPVIEIPVGLLHVARRPALHIVGIQARGLTKHVSTFAQMEGTELEHHIRPTTHPLGVLRGVAESYVEDRIVNSEGGMLISEQSSFTCCVAIPSHSTRLQSAKVLALYHLQLSRQIVERRIMVMVCQQLRQIGRNDAITLRINLGLLTG